MTIMCQTIPAFSTNIKVQIFQEFTDYKPTYTKISIPFMINSSILLHHINFHL